MRTHRLELLPLDDSHAALILALFNDPDFLQHVGDKGVRTEAQARDYLRSGPMAEQRRSGITNYAVRLQGTAPWLGTCGLLQRPFLPGPDIGYAFLPSARGQGIAREAAQAIVQQADRDGRPALWAMVNPDNTRSLGLLQSLGFTTPAQDSPCPLPNTRVLVRQRPALHR
jgi:[ribosomal protein S5]-alanine N-acetyltransferase